MSRLTADQRYLWNEGTDYQCYTWMGAQTSPKGTWFRVWAPNADAVAVMGDFNDWSSEAHPMRDAGGGLWEVHIRSAQPGARYKYRLNANGEALDRTDPFAFALEPPAENTYEGIASIVVDLDDYTWADNDWMADRSGPDSLNEPISIYELHLGSWRHQAPGESYSYRDIAEPLAEYVTDMGYTHIELMPVAEHPYYGSWGYQTLGYYAPTFRYGSPQDFMHFVDTMHQHGIGVLMDWVPAHFATDPQGLTYFDGTHLFAYDDPQMRHHPDWGTYVFDYGRNGVRNFLIGNALFWLDYYHIDGLRVDAVASMLYRDYSRGTNWTPNEHGGRENLEAIRLLRDTNTQVYKHFPDAMTIAEESTAFPGVTKPVDHGGLGFLYKWNMGWMNDTLEYIEKEPIHRKYHHGDFTWTLSWAFSEQFMLPFSHDEVVHGKESMWGKMPGDDWQKAANLRVLYTHQYGHPGKVLSFMGNEFGQHHEWNHDESIEWHLQDKPLHAGLQQWVADLNALYRSRPALWNDDRDSFQWIHYGDREQSVLSYLRQHGDQVLVFVLNMTPVARTDYRVGLPQAGTWTERLNSDADVYGGSGVGNAGRVEATENPYLGQPASASIVVPPLGALILSPKDQGDCDATPKTPAG